MFLLMLGLVFSKEIKQFHSLSVTVLLYLRSKMQISLYLYVEIL